MLPVGFRPSLCHHSAHINSPKHPTITSLGNHPGGSILAAKVAQFLTAIDNREPELVGRPVKPGDWIRGTEELSDIDRAGPRPTDWGDLVDNRLTQSPGPKHWDILGPRPESDEIERFREAWPIVSARLGLDAPPAPKRLFDPGRVYFAKSLTCDIHALVDRHAGGDWGEHGFHGVLTVEDAWQLPTVEAANRLAVSTARGAVQSRFADVGVDVITWMGATTRTLITEIPKPNPLYARQE